MIFITGGYAQGKLDFARETLGVENFNDGCFGEADCVYNLADMVDDENFENNLNTYIEEHPHCVIICNEVGGGIVPMEKSEREHREKVGRVSCMLAGRAEAVYRVICGIGTRIK
jgi:adenosyl cobinamide kinase/adenosyl cobinamide phosphate guanylyltransferase